MKKIKISIPQKLNIFPSIYSFIFVFFVPPSSTAFDLKQYLDNLWNVTLLI